jgi:pyruvate,water dikinase
MSEITSLAEAIDPQRFGPKAVQLGAAIRAGLPVPGGLALSHEAVSGVGGGRRDAVARLFDALQVACADGTQWAVRSSAVGEDSPLASFAGIHLSVLGVCGAEAIARAVCEVHASASDAGASAYRSHLGLATEARMAVIVQQLVDADVAGVMFTRNPVTGAEERVIEASWGLGEAVVAGLVTPDRYVLDRSGRLHERQLGEKDVAVRRVGPSGTREVPVADDLVEIACLDDADLAALHALAWRCDAAFGSTEHDIEFAIRAGAVYLLQRRPITRA